jgi:hypothetical protein
MGQRQHLGETLRRVAFIRLIARWLGKPTVSDIQEAFGLSLAQAYRVLGAALDGTMETQTGDARSVLDFLRAQSLSNKLQTGLGLQFGIAVEDVDAQMLPRLSEDITREILHAIRAKRALSVAYTARKGTSDRVISPTHLVHVFNRYHLRAWDHEKRGYRDFLLSRITEAKMAKERRIAPHDKDWEERIILLFCINPGLPLGLRSALAVEWGLEGDTREIQCRKAVARYVVRRLTERTTIGLRRWVPQNQAAREIFDMIEAQVERN